MATTAPNTEKVMVNSRPDKRRHRLRRWLVIFILLVLLAIMLPFVVVQLINDSNAERMYDSVAQVPARPVAIVFGAGLRPDGTPSTVLADRLDAAISLYKAGKVKQLLMTGDEMGNTEVSAMRNYARNRGVPVTAILADQEGLRTYDSCYRAAHSFNISRAVLVTQAYHLPRALYLCNALGVEAVGLKAGLDSNYRNQSYYDSREFLATFAAWVDVTFSHPNPK